MSELALKLIEENKRTKDTFLDLGNCGLTELPKVLFDCFWLERLNLGEYYFNEKSKFRKTGNNGNRNKFSGKELILLEKLTNINSLDLYNNQISDISFLEKLTSLNALDLSSNQISDIRFVEKLSNLTSLDLSSNQISDIRFLKKLSHLNYLDFSSNQISDIRFLEKLSNLTSLGLSSNQISDYSFLEKLSNLTLLYLSSNQISDIRFLEKLTNLNDLDLSFNQISDYSFLENLNNLNILNLRDNQISDIRFLEKLTNLTSLDLSSNQISDIRFLEKLTNLNYLKLFRNQISDIRFLEKLTNLNLLNLCYNQISDIRFLENLSNLTSLNLSSNQISDIRFLEKFSNLNNLNLSFNQISDIRLLEKLSNLNDLNLSRNQISDIRFVEKLSNLTSLDFSENQISDIKPLMPLLQKGLEIDINGYGARNEINLRENPIINPPLEIVKQGREAVIRYFEKIEAEGTGYIYEAKLTLVGEGGAGKTSLQARMLDKNAPLPKSEERTRGIKVTELKFKDSQNLSYTVNVWDFGGQDVYYPVHRFFLTENSVYVLMATTRIAAHNFEYWIPTIYQFGGDSPIILVQTCHDGNRANWNDLGIFYSNPHFKLIKPHYELNLPNNNEGLEKLKKGIEQQVIHLPHIGEAVPASWKKIREALSEERKKYACISYDKFVDLCRTADNGNFQLDQDIVIVGRFFADLGIILWYYDKEYLKDWVILQPQWAMNAVYKIIDDVNVQKCGIVHNADFDRLWNGQEYANRKTLLQKMLQEFKIAFPKKHSTADFILPTRLGAIDKAQQWTNVDKSIRLQYDFDFMPRGVVNQISAELSRYITSDNEVWNNAVNFIFNTSQAQVEEDFFNRKIYVKADGNEARSLVVLIMNAIDNTLQGYKGVKATIQVPCSCEECKKNPEPTLFSYNKLMEWRLKNLTVRCNESATDILIGSLLFDAGFEPTKDRSAFLERDINGMTRNQDKIHIEFKPEINVSPIISNTQNNNPPPAPEPKKEEKKEDRTAEDKAVKQWKRASIWWFLGITLVSLLLFYFYRNESEIIMSKVKWEEFKTSSEDSLAKWILGIIWSAFTVRMLYDRYFDPAKEKSVRDLYKHK